MSKINFKKVGDRLKQGAVMGAGAVASNYVGNFIGTKFPKVKPAVNAGIRVGLGALLPAFMGSSKKESFITHLADGMLAEGSVAFAKAMGVPGISGTDIDDPISGLGSYSVDGTDITDPISGVD